MSEKTPQPTAVLIKRLRRVAKWHDGESHAAFIRGSTYEITARSRANTCWQAAARLEEMDAVISQQKEVN